MHFRGLFFQKPAKSGWQEASESALVALLEVRDQRFGANRSLNYNVSVNRSYFRR